MKDCNKYIGHPVGAAKRLAEADGLSTRIVMVNGKPRICTMDLRTDRVNFRVKTGSDGHDIVVEAYKG